MSSAFAKASRTSRSVIEEKRTRSTGASVSVTDELVGLLADEFALAVVVSRNGGASASRARRRQRGDDVLLRGCFRHVGVDEFDRFYVAPVVVLRGESTPTTCPTDQRRGVSPP